MIITRSYLVLDRLVHEVSCIHGADLTQSHLVFREEQQVPDPSPVALLGAIAEAARTCWYLAERDRVTLYDDCGL
jgi:hypothetical protein